MMNNLDVNNWKWFNVKDILECKTTEYSPVSEMEFGLTPYVSRTALNNGVSDCFNCDSHTLIPGNCITIGAEGRFAFYQDDSFLAGVKIYRLTNPHLNKYNALFVCTVLNLRAELYSYGYARVLKKILNEKIKLPWIEENGLIVPDWIFMESYIKNIYQSKLQNVKTKIVANKNKDFNINKWHFFKIGDILNKVKCQKFSSIPDSDGAIPVVSCSSINQGITCTCGETVTARNAITISTNGECFDCFYHDYDFVTTTDAEILTNEYLNKYNALFLCTVFKQEKPKWGYGRKPKSNKIYESYIKLPSTINQKNDIIPDWKYMENYIKNLPYGDKI